MNNKTQYQLLQEMQDAGFNLVNCGRCGRYFIHKTPSERLFCPECGFHSDCSDFPDFIAEEIEENYTLPLINFTECEGAKDKYDFTYECTKKGAFIEFEGCMEPYYTGRSIEHHCIWGFTNDGYSEIVESEKGLPYEKTISSQIEQEIYEAFYNHFTK